MSISLPTWQISEDEEEFAEEAQETVMLSACL